MKILHVIHSLDPRSGGPSHAIREMVREQLRVGHEVTVLATTTQTVEPWIPAEEFREAICGEPVFEGAEVCLGRSFGRRRPWSRFAYTPECRRWLVNRVSDRRTAPNVIHIHGTFSDLTRAAASTARRYSVPYVLRPAGSLNEECLARGTQWAKRVFTTAFLARDLRQSGRVQAMSKAEQNQLARYVDEGRIAVVPHGIEFPKDATDARQESGGGNCKEPFLLFLSRIHEKKRPEWILEAFATMKHEYPDMRIVFAGTDDGHEAIVRATAARVGLTDRVEFPGFVRGAEKAALLRAARLFVLPSIDENFGVSVVEAMAHGTPVLVTPGVATHEYVDESGGGLTVSDGIGAVADGMRQLLSQDRASSGQRGQEFVRRHLAWDSVVQSLDDMYCSAMGEAGVRNGH